MTLPYGDSDIAFALKDVGVPVVAGGVNSYGALDLQDKLIVQDSQRGEVVALVPSTTSYASMTPPEMEQSRSCI
jgi:hypothetical protein